MSSRFILAAVPALALLAGAHIALAASSVDPTGPAAPSGERFRLACHGAMSTDGRLADRSETAQRIEASGVVDLATMAVSGFGVGVLPIVAFTPGTIGFGAAPVERLMPAVDRSARKSDATTGSGPIVEGSIDRLNGATVVVVHPAADPEAILIAMALDCAFEPAPR